MCIFFNCFQTSPIHSLNQKKYSPTYNVPSTKSTFEKPTPCVTRTFIIATNTTLNTVPVSSIPSTSTTLNTASTGIIPSTSTTFNTNSVFLSNSFSYNSPSIKSV